VPERLESRLAELAREVEYPPTPELAVGVRRRIGARAPRRRPAWRHERSPRRWRPPRGRRALALAISLALLGAAGAAAAVPAVRHAVGDVFGLRGATVRRVPRTPPAPATARRDLGARVTLAAARRLAGFPVVLARDPRLGAPRAVHLARTAGGDGARVTLVYRDGTVTLTELRGSTELDLVRKLTPRSTPVRRVIVRGEPGLYVGGPHVVLFRDASGRIVEDRARTAGRVLLWQRGPLLLRLEADVGFARALQIARSVR
jgi:hypothetical protein